MNKKIIKPFIIIIWITLSLLFTEFMLELMTKPDTFTDLIGLFGILLIVYYYNKVFILLMVYYH